MIKKQNFVDVHGDLDAPVVPKHTHRTRSGKPRAFVPIPSLSVLFVILASQFSQFGVLDAAELRVPAFTAYISPNAEAARVSEKSGVTRWDDPKESVQWFGKFAKTGALTVQVELSLPQEATSKLRLTFDEQSRELTVEGKGPNALVTADFGAFQVGQVGYKRIRLESLNEAGVPSGC